MGGPHQARRIGGNEQSQESEQESTQYSHDRRRYLAARPSGHKRRCDLRLALQRSPVLRAGRRGSLHYQSQHGVSLETIIPITGTVKLVAGWRGFAITPAGLRLLADLRHTLHDPPTQLRQQTVITPTESVAIA